MTRFRAAYALALALAGSTAACGPSTTTGDGGPDVMSPDGMVDGGEDAMTDAPIGDGGMCNRVAIEDLNALGTVTSGVLRYTGTNADAPEMTNVGIQVPAALQRICAFRSVRQRVFSYTPRTSSLLHISTNNPGTSIGFDTTLAVVTGNCGVATGSMRQTFIACNDDDPLFGSDDRRQSSNVLTLPVNAGQTVYIGLGAFAGLDGSRNNREGETGTFELSIEEQTAVADGMPCDVRGVQNACSPSSTCVPGTYPSDNGTCRPDGSVAGAACAAGSCSGTGLTCVGQSGTNPGICVQANVAIGNVCDPFHTCVDTATCVTLQRGGTSGICRALGTVVGAECRSDGTCDAGLTCQSGGGGPGTCLRAAPAGGMCSTYDSTCPSGQDCVGAGNSGTAGTCHDLGTAVGADCDAGTCTGTGLTCSAGGYCARTVATGEECGLFDNCADGGTCYLVDVNSRFRGRCFAPGTRGGPCRGTGTPCDTGLTCSDPDGLAQGRCIAMAPSGGACDFIAQCPEAESCVRTTGGTTFMGVCRPRGALGAPCRHGASPCDAGMTCSSPYTADGICQQAATAGGACDARASTNQCPAGQVCRATGLDTGTCAVPAMETEPNNVAHMAMNVTLPAAVAASLATNDSDCFGFDVPANGKVFARTSSPHGLCPANMALDLYRVSGTDVQLLGSDTSSGVFGCPRIDGNDPFNNFGWARGLAAGRYAVCVRNAAETRAPVYSYVLSVNATP
jgi:hypothetical protein